MRWSDGFLRLVQFSRILHVRTCPVNGELILIHVQYKTTRIIYPRKPKFFHGPAGCSLLPCIRPSPLHHYSANSSLMNIMKNWWVLYNVHVFVGLKNHDLAVEVKKSHRASSDKWIVSKQKNLRNQGWLLLTQIMLNHGPYYMG